MYWGSEHDSRRAPNDGVLILGEEEEEEDEVKVAWCADI